MLFEPNKRLKIITSHIRNDCPTRKLGSLGRRKVPPVVSSQKGGGGEHLLDLEWRPDVIRLIT